MGRQIEATPVNGQHERQHEGQHVGLDLKPDEGIEDKGVGGSSGLCFALSQLLLSPHVQSLKVLKAWAVSAVTMPTAVLITLWGTNAALPILVDTAKWYFTCIRQHGQPLTF